MIQLLNLMPVVGPYLAAAASFATSRLGSVIVAGGLAYGLGHHHGADRVRNQVAVAQAAETTRQARAAIVITGKANRREGDSDDAAVRDQQRVRTFDESLPSRDNCILSDADRQRLRPIGQGSFPLAAPAGAIRKAGTGAKPRAIGKNAKSALAEYRAALAEANRRLSNDGAFYDDVLGEFGMTR